MSNKWSVRFWFAIFLFNIFYGLISFAQGHMFGLINVAVAGFMGFMRFGSFKMAWLWVKYDAIRELF